MRKIGSNGPLHELSQDVRCGDEIVREDHRKSKLDESHYASVRRLMALNADVKGYLGHKDVQKNPLRSQELLGEFDFLDACLHYWKRNKIFAY
jgi:hypothetical protein